MAFLKKKLSGSTLIETLVAMILLITAFSLFFFAVIKIKGSYKTELRTNAMTTINRIIDSVEIVDSSFEEKIIVYNSFSIRIFKETYMSLPDVYLLTVEAVGFDSVAISKSRKLLFRNNEEN
jgi:hypothetical protein